MSLSWQRIDCSAISFTISFLSFQPTAFPVGSGMPKALEKAALGTLLITDKALLY